MVQVLSAYLSALEATKSLDKNEWGSVHVLTSNDFLAEENAKEIALQRYNHFPWPSYESCLEGATPAEIAAALTEQGIKSPMGNDLWSAGTVRSILRNEKYCGDALMQKTYTKDFRTHKSVKNTDLNMYFKENHHTAIVKKEDWIKVQKLLSERHSTAKRATLRRLSNHFVAYRVKDGLFKGYLIMDSRWSFMERQEFMKIVDEAQNTMK